MAQLWAGRFKKQLSEATNDFNSSISVDCKMYAEDVAGSMAHAAMLGAKGIISLEDSKKIIDGLQGILEDIESGTLEFDSSAEDIHMFIEAELTNRIGDAGRRLHTARSRNDQVALDTRMYLKKKITEVKSNLLSLIKTLCAMAEENKETVMCGYTHMQRAQPVTFAHHLMAYASMLMRDVDRLNDCYKRTDVLPLGSCALAGTTYDVDRFDVARRLGFSSVCANSLDGVSDRDFVIELAGALSIIMTHLSRFSEEIILWCSWEFKYIELDDAYSTGSSIMPQKKNPDIAELVRGKTGRVFGNLITILTVMKALPLAYNKDMQEDKECVFDSIDTVNVCLPIFKKMLSTATVKKDNMIKAAQNGFINATDCADYLTKKGMPFRTAYKITGELVAYCIDNAFSLNSLPLETYKSFSEQFEQDVYEAVDLFECVKKRASYGAPNAQSVDKQIELCKGFINK